MPSSGQTCGLVLLVGAVERLSVYNPICLKGPFEKEEEDD